MKIIVIPVTSFEQNCSLLICEKSQRAAVVDPGGEPERIIAAAEQADVRIEKILLTHGHFDHVGATAALAKQLELPIEGPQREDQFLIDALPQWCQQFGFPASETFKPQRWLEDGDKVQVGEHELQVIHCPGHTPGHVVFYNAHNQVAIVGDVLFRGAIGRTDFPRGNQADLLASIQDKLWPLGDEVIFYPGHGPTSTFGEEKRSNPYVRG